MWSDSPAVGALVHERVRRTVVAGELRGQLALLQQTVQDASLRHGVHGAGRQQVGALLAARARVARPQQRRPEHCCQVVHRHFVLALVLVHPVHISKCQLSSSNTCMRVRPSILFMVTLHILLCRTNLVFLQATVLSKQNI